MTWTEFFDGTAAEAWARAAVGRETGWDWSSGEAISVVDEHNAWGGWAYVSPGQEP